MDGGMVLLAAGLSKSGRMGNGSPLKEHQVRLLRAIFHLM